eukprot:1923482-Ditylum_brightwellii.AAC.1
MPRFKKTLSRNNKEKLLQLSWSMLPWHGQVQLCTELKEARSAHALYHGTAEAPAGLVCQGHQKAGQKVKDLNMFVKDKIKETIKERNHDMHAMSNFEDLSISFSNKSIHSIISNTSVEGSDDKSRKPAHKE